MAPIKKHGLKNNKGMALMVALFAVVLLLFVAAEVSYESNVEYIVAAQQVNRLKAYYAAKAGVEISLLRILIYKKVMASVGDSLGEAKSMLDPIWALPIAWPPIAPDDLSEVDKDQIQTAVKNSAMDAQYMTSISAEGGALDINDLASPVESLRKATKLQIARSLSAEIENNEEFGDKYRDKNLDEVLNNIVDWVDEDSESLNGGDEKSYYSEIQSDFIPPNQPFKTMEEIHMVKGVTDEIFDVLKKSVTVYGTKGINVNYATFDMLRALDVSMDEKIVNEVLARRSNPEKGGPFKNPEEFLSYIGGLGANAKAIEESKIPILTEPEYNFRIHSTGLFSNVTREITVVTYDFENLKEKLISFLDKEEKEKNPPPPANPPSGGNPPPDNNNGDGKKTIKVPEGRPTVVFWDET